MVCIDCPTTTPPPTCPDPPNGSNCCLRLKYTCAFGVWTLTTSDCVDNALCSPLLQICEAEDFYYEQQNGCVCFSVPGTVCTPPDVDCSCDSPTTTTTTTTTTTSTTTTTTTTSTTTTSTAVPPCAASANSSWDFDVTTSGNGPTSNTQTSPSFEMTPAGSANCCYRVDFSLVASITLTTTIALGPTLHIQGGILDVLIGPGFRAVSCGGTASDPIAFPAGNSIAFPGGQTGPIVYDLGAQLGNSTVFVCGAVGAQSATFQAGADTTGGAFQSGTTTSRVQGTLSWTITHVGAC